MASRKTKAKITVYPKKSGIRIREVNNSKNGQKFGISYLVDIPARIAGIRKRKQFSLQSEARSYAEGQFNIAQVSGHRGFALSDSNREDAIKALHIVRGLNLSLTEAAEFAHKHLSPPKGDITVCALIEELIEAKHNVNLRSRSINDLKSRLGLFSESFGNYLVKSVSNNEIRVWLKESFPEYSPRSIKNYRNCIHSFFSYAVENGYREDNPVTRIPVPKEDWKPPVILTPEQASRLLETAVSRPQLRLLPFVTLQLFAGLRTTEITRLTWDAINLEEKILTIGANIAKKRQFRIVELMPVTIAWLECCHPKKGEITPGRFDDRLAELRKLAGFENWRKDYSNAARHSFASYLYALTSDSAKVSAAIGHRGSDVVLFDFYRSVARKIDADAYFNLYPESISHKIVPFKAAPTKIT